MSLTAKSNFFHFFYTQRDAASRESLALVEDDCNIWDEDDSGEVNIRFDKKRPGVVVGASFNKLVERITSVTDHGKKRLIK